jgi:aryl-alcohol dehydrogenase-like predicted oxidoreductase
MQYRTLGRTNLRVSVLGFGGAEIGYEKASDRDVDKIVGSAIDAGVNVFDTAECYGDGEEMLGRALSGKRGSVFIFTKCGHASGLEGPDWSASMLERSIYRSLHRLKTDYVDLIQLHSCSERILRDGEAIDVLDRAKSAGRARFIGYSGDSSDALTAVRLGRFDTLQTSVNIADQEAIELTIPIARDAGMGVISKRSIANAAWKAGRAPDNPYHATYWQRLSQLRYDFLDGSMTGAIGTALKFTLSVPGVNTAIVGTKSPERWEQNRQLVDSEELPASTFAYIRNRWRSVAGADWTGQV